MRKVGAKEPATLPQGKGETILLVEDAKRLRQAMRDILESLDYHVLIAANGQDALEVYRSAEETHAERGQGRVELLIADLVMPVMGGQQLLQTLREETPDLKALAITGYVGRTDPQELQEAGFLDVVHKPFDADYLARVVRRALDGD